MSCFTRLPSVEKRQAEPESYGPKLSHAMGLTREEVHWRVRQKFPEPLDIEVHLNKLNIILLPVKEFHR
jgi:hypothetical protein